MDASSAQTLNASLAAKIREQAFPTKFLLVLENANGLVVEDHIHNLPDSPILVTSTEPAISKLASFTACKFQLSAGATQQEMQKVLSSIEKALEPKQQVTAIVANGGTGKTQIVLQFVSKNTSRLENQSIRVLNFDTYISTDFQIFGSLMLPPMTFLLPILRGLEQLQVLVKK